MKIVQITSFFSPSVGGVERQVEEIATHLQAQGIKVQVLTTDATHGVEKRMQRLDDSFKGVPVRRSRHVLALGYFFRFAPMLLWKLFVADFDIVHLHNSHDAHLLGAIIIKTLRRKKLVLTGHNPYIVGMEKRGENLNLGVRFFELIFRWFFAWGVDLYIALLESEKREVQKRFGWKDSKLLVVPNGIQEVFYEQSGQKERFYREWQIEPHKWDLIVGTVSRINFVKGLQNLQPAVHKLKRILFIFAGGDAGYLSTLKRIYNDDRNVLFTERYLASEQVRDFYQALDIFLLPSVYEPFGMTMVEAMAQAKPVLATSRGGPAEVVTAEFGELLDPADSELWLQRLKYYSEHKELLAPMGEAARGAAHDYQWSTVMQRLTEAYQKLLR